MFRTAPNVNRHVMWDAINFYSYIFITKADDLCKCWVNTYVQICMLVLLRFCQISGHTRCLGEANENRTFHYIPTYRIIWTLFIPEYKVRIILANFQIQVAINTLHHSGNEWLMGKLEVYLIVTNVNVP